MGIIVNKGRAKMDIPEKSRKSIIFASGVIVGILLGILLVITLIIMANMIDSSANVPCCTFTQIKIIRYNDDVEENVSILNKGFTPDRRLFEGTKLSLRFINLSENKDYIVTETIGGGYFRTFDSFSNVSSQDVTITINTTITSIHLHTYEFEYNSTSWEFFSFTFYYLISIQLEWMQ